jgi:integrase
MADIDDRWYRTDKTTGDRVPTARHGTGRRWDARWHDGERQRHKAFTRKEDAKSFLAKVTTDLERGAYVDPRAGQVTVAAYGAQWRSEQLHRDSTAEFVERAFRRHVDPVIGHLRLSQVRSSHLQAWVKNRSRVLAPSTLRVVYSYVVSMLSRAATDRLIGVSPCVDVRLPEIAHREQVIPTREQIHALAAALPKRYQAVPLLAAATGLRGGELFGLELPGSVDFLHREIRVHQQLTVTSGRSPYLALPKTKTSTRAVELPEVAGLALAQHLERFPVAPVEVDDATDPRKPVRRAARLVFCNESGAPVHRASWSHVWALAARKADLPPGFGLHGLRHFFATSLIHAGASVKTVQIALGHSSPTVTLNTYVGEWPEAVDRTRAIMDAALGLRQMCADDEAAR